MLRSLRAGELEIGRLGSLELLPGCYVYVGSALGPGGVRARVNRHSRGGGPRHWHLDHLLPAVELEEVWYTHDAERRECVWSEVFPRMSGASVPLPGFGASDCRCRSHLVFFESAPALNSFRRRVHAAVPGHHRVLRGE